MIRKSVVVDIYGINASEQAKRGDKERQITFRCNVQVYILKGQ